MVPFSFKPSHLLDEQDLLEHLVWAEYYEPDEFEEFARLGMDVDGARAALEAVNYSDAYIFPLLCQAADSNLKYLHLSIQVTTAQSKGLVGYVTDACFGEVVDIF